MQRTFNALIIWDTNDEHGLVQAVNDLVDRINQNEDLKATPPHIYPETPIIIEIKNINSSPLKELN